VFGIRFFQQKVCEVATIFEIPVPAGSNALAVNPVGVSPDGATLVGSIQVENGDSLAFKYSVAKKSFTFLAAPADAVRPFRAYGRTTVAEAVTGYMVYNGATRGVVYGWKGNMIPLNPFGEYDSSNVFDGSASNAIQVGGVYSSSRTDLPGRPAKWVNRVGQFLDLAGATSGTGVCVSGDGRTMAGYGSFPQIKPIVWTVVGTHVLDLPGGWAGGRPVGLSVNGQVLAGNGQVIGNRSGVGSVPFVHTDEFGVRVLPLPADHQTGQATGVSPDGRVVVGFSRDANWETHGWVWSHDGTVATDLNDLLPLENGRRLYSVNGIGLAKNSTYVLTGMLQGDMGKVFGFVATDVVVP
jgi:probable HAF family extracellular repeat protein